MPTDDDSAWKNILETHLRASLEFFFPRIHRDIDWSRGYVSLDKELTRISRDSKTRKRIADKLFKVQMLKGKPARLLIHIDVQGKPEAGFAYRMFQYNYRLHDRSGEEVISLVVITGPHSSFRPIHFEQKRWGFELVMRFPVVKLLDFEHRREELKASRNPFALVVLAHLESRRTRGKPGEAFHAKWGLTRMLYERGWKKRDIIGLYNFIDWVLRLPEDLELKIRDRVMTLEGRKKMPYVSFIERYGMKIGEAKGEARGEAKGLRAAIAFGLKLRFGRQGLDLVPRLNEVRAIRSLRALLRAVHTVKSLDAFRGKLPQA